MGADFWALLKVSDFESKDALQQLIQMSSKDDVQMEMQRLKAAQQREKKMGMLISGMEEDARIALQEDRHARYKADCEERRLTGAKEISFDSWVEQYEWRYDADERMKVREKWPSHFGHSGPAPLPVEPWEVDYLTYKEIDKIMYHRETASLAARKRANEAAYAPTQAAATTQQEQDGFTCSLEVDEEDEAFLRSAVVRKGYNYWW